MLYIQKKKLICYDMLYIKNVGESVKSFAEAVSSEPIKVGSSKIIQNSFFLDIVNLNLLNHNYHDV